MFHQEHLNSAKDREFHLAASLNQQQLTGRNPPHISHSTVIYPNKLVTFSSKQSLNSSLDAHLHTAAAPLDWLSKAYLNIFSMPHPLIPWRNMAKHGATSASRCCQPSCTLFFLLLHHKYRNWSFYSTPSNLLLEPCSDPILSFGLSYPLQPSSLPWLLLQNYELVWLLPLPY